MADKKDIADMPIEEDEDDAIAALLSASVDSGSKSYELSPEDAAWVDTCLVADPQLSEDDWSAMRDALLETLTTRLTSKDEEPSNAHLVEIAEESKDSDEYVQAGEEAEPTLITEGEDKGDDGVENYLGSLEDIESHNNIFKVWDLETPEEDEENELIKQLKKALMESKFRAPPPSLDDTSIAENEQQVEELIAGMGDLSLKQSSE